MHEHLFKIALTVARRGKPPLNLKGIPCPIQTCGLSQQRSPTAIEKTADNFVLGIVILRLRIFIHIKTRVPTHAMTKSDLMRIGQPLQIENGERLPVVEPIKTRGKLLVIHTVTPDRHNLGFCLGILFDMPFPRLLVEIENKRWPTQRMHH